jgi:hypothetical protein
MLIAHSMPMMTMCPAELGRAPLATAKRFFKTAFVKLVGELSMSPDANSVKAVLTRRLSTMRFVPIAHKLA